MAIALDEVEIAVPEKLVAEQIVRPPESAPPPQIVKRSRPKWAKWALVVGVVAALGIGVQLWRMHAQNAIGYETVAVDRGTLSPPAGTAPQLRFHIILCFSHGAPQSLSDNVRHHGIRTPNHGEQQKSRRIEKEL